MNKNKEKTNIKAATLKDVQKVANLAILMWKSDTVEESAREFYDYINEEKGIIFLAEEMNVRLVLHSADYGMIM